MPNGMFPQVITLTSSQDEIARAANEVANFLKEGYPRKHLLLLPVNGQGAQALIQASIFEASRKNVCASASQDSYIARSRPGSIAFKSRDGISRLAF